MDHENIYTVEESVLFSESKIWALNRDYYQTVGLDAWSKGSVPHHITSNSKVGKTYAEIIFGFLKDLAFKGQTTEILYILELGAGHGRLAFHTLKHLDQLIEQAQIKLPPFCYVLSDIVESNLDFFLTHPQFKDYLDRGILDVCYFDGIQSEELQLRVSGKNLKRDDLKQPIMAIANYFFDSIPSDLFSIKDDEMKSCEVALTSYDNPDTTTSEALLKNLKLDFTTKEISGKFYNDTICNELLNSYKSLLKNAHLLFPATAIQCIENLKNLSSKGLIIISMDKGVHEIHDLENSKIPRMVTHGSMSFSVNYHALGLHCNKSNGTVMFPTYSTFHLEVACFMYLKESESYSETRLAYKRYVDDFGPDDLNSLKKLAYKHIPKMNISELIGLSRWFSYDSTIFIHILPRLKFLVSNVTYNERTRVFQTLNEVWKMHFSINELHDIAFEIGGILYQLAYFDEAIEYFQHSEDKFGNSPDVLYNKALCYYQLRKDDDFTKTLLLAKTSYPEFESLKHLEKLDLNAV